MATYTYTIFDADPNTSCGCQWPSHEDREIEADDADEAIENVREVMECAAPGLNPADGYEPGQRLYAIVWDADEIIVGIPTYVLTAKELGIEGLEAAISALEASGYDVHETSVGTRYIADLAPDSSVYEGGTDNPEWDSDCELLRAEVLAIVAPHGCTVEWSDNDLTIAAVA